MIKNLKLKNFTVFKNVRFTFGRTLNVIIGENGAGKSHVLKVLYAANTAVLGEQVNHVAARIRQSLHKVFMAVDADLITRSNCKSASSGTLEIATDTTATPISFTLDHDAIPEEAVYDTNTMHTVFIPAKELLSIYPNFIVLWKKYDLSYDRTFYDTIMALSMPSLKTIPVIHDEIIGELESAIGAKVYLSKDTKRFVYQAKGDDKETDINLAAEGWCRLGMLMQLLRNGSIEKGGHLFWDEPEANLNPRLVKLVAKAIFALGKAGVQVFVTTHSLFLLRELEMLRSADKNIKQGDVRFFNLSGKGKVEQGDSPEELGNILFLDESVLQSQRYLDQESRHDR